MHLHSQFRTNAYHPFPKHLLPLFKRVWEEDVTMHIDTELSYSHDNVSVHDRAKLLDAKCMLRHCFKGKGEEAKVN